jgi:hypothetical protein
MRGSGCLTNEALSVTGKNSLRRPVSNGVLIMDTPGIAPRVRVYLLLIVLGAVGGALASIPLTWLGKVISQAPDPATIANYWWNMRAFGIMGALFSPVLTWSSMRQVPLWRTMIEPAIGGLVGAVVGLFLGSGSIFLVLAATGICLATWRLNRAYRRPVAALESGADGRVLATGDG